MGFICATVWSHDKLLVLLFYSGAPNKHVKQAHSKPLVQTIINLQNSASRFSRVHCQQCGRQKRSLSSPDAPWVELLLQRCLYWQNVSHSNGCSSLRIRPQTYGMKSQKWQGYCTTSHLHCRRTFLTVSAEWPVVLSWRYFQLVPDTSPQTHNISGTAEMTCNTVPSQCDPMEWDDTKQHVKWSTALSVMNFSKTCISIINVDDNTQSLAFQFPLKGPYPHLTDCSYLI